MLRNCAYLCFVRERNGLQIVVRFDLWGTHHNVELLTYLEEFILVIFFADVVGRAKNATHNNNKAMK